MASSLPSSTPRYDVFLSSAEDARVVLASRLYSTWLRKGISTYLSEDESKRDSSVVSFYPRVSSFVSSDPRVSSFVSSDPRVSAFVPSYLVPSDPRVSSFVPSYPVTSDPRVSAFVPSYPVPSDPRVSSFVPSYPVTSDPRVSAFVPSYPVPSDPRVSSFVPSYPVTSDPRVSSFVPSYPVPSDPRVSSFVSPGPRKNIEGSKIAVVVVSQRYLTSVWCLKELQTILSLEDQCRLLILPVFYKVNMSDIRRQSGKFEESFRELRQTNPEKVQAWKIALTKLTNIPGLDLHDLSDEGDMVETITTKVQAMLSDLDIPSKVSEMVGLDRHMKALYKLLDLNKSEIRLIGTSGPGGVGKTTLARFTYQDLYNNFQTHMFVDKAENIYYQDPVTTESEETSTSEVQEGSQSKTKGQVSTTLIKSTVGHRNSLLVIDCVENLDQLKAVAEIVGLCGSGSRVILITQDKNLLDQFGVKHVYEVNSLRYNEALQLFCISAFERECPPPSFESLSLRAVQIASLLPLALKILGSFLKDKNEGEWERELQKYEGYREKNIMERMKKTYKREDDKDQIPSFVFKG